VNGHTEMPTLTFGGGCTYDTLDSILNGNTGTGWEHGGVSYGWAVRAWFKQGVIVTALWGWTHYNNEEDDDFTSLLAWDEVKQDYCNKLSVRTDDITRLEIL